MTLDPGPSPWGQTPLAALRRFARRPVSEECCELCSLPLGPEHPHLVELASRKLVCACTPCAVLFSSHAAPRYRRVPQDVRFLPDFRLSDVQWSALMVPTGLAFFFHNSQAGKVVATYPSPGGPTEAALELAAWDDVVGDNPVLQTMQPDTEALLVNRMGPARDHFLVGIDECYKLVGLVRTHWQGFSGGPEVWQQIERFFGGLKERSVPVRGAGHG
jgi:hypothetical protein